MTRHWQALRYQLQVLGSATNMGFLFGSGAFLGLVILGAFFEVIFGIYFYAFSDLQLTETPFNYIRSCSAKYISR